MQGYVPVSDWRLYLETQRRDIARHCTLIYLPRCYVVYLPVNLLLENKHHKTCVTICSAGETAVYYVRYLKGELYLATQLNLPQRLRKTLRKQKQTLRQATIFWQLIKCR